MIMQKAQIPDNLIVENLIALRDRLSPRAFNSTGTAINADLAEVVFKINSCLYRENPKF